MPRPHALLALLILAGLAGCRNGGTPPASLPVTGDPAAVQAIPSERIELEVSERVTGLAHPWALAFLPDGGYLVTEKVGNLRRVAPDGRVSAPIQGLPKLYVSGQSGLLDVVLSPDFAQDGWVYLSFAQPNFRGNLAGTAVARGRLEGDALTGVEVIYSQEPKLSSGTHVGSRLVFDGQGHLFVTQGDNRVGMAESQQLDKLQGKLVRILPDSGIPADNPFVGRADARPEIWSYGHRNMQGAALHPQTGQLWTSEHGPKGGDELNVPAPGLNYGWPVVTHGIDYTGLPISGSVGKAAPGMEPPHHVWMVSPGLSGMAFYTGDLLPQWRGNLFLGALASRELIRLELEGDRVVHEERLLGVRGERIRDVRQGPDGALYLLVDDPNNGKVLRVAPRAAVRPRQEPAR